MNGYMFPAMPQFFFSFCVTLGGEEPMQKAPISWTV